MQIYSQCISAKIHNNRHLCWFPSQICTASHKKKGGKTVHDKKRAQVSDKNNCSLFKRHRFCWSLQPILAPTHCNDHR